MELEYVISQLKDDKAIKLVKEWYLKSIEEWVEPLNDLDFRKVSNETFNRFAKDYREVTNYWIEIGTLEEINANRQEYQTYEQGLDSFTNGTDYAIVYK